MQESKQRSSRSKSKSSSDRPVRKGTSQEAPPTRTLAMTIAAINDQMRMNPQRYGELQIEPSLARRDDQFQLEMFEALATYSDFYPGSDPRGHHDFGLFSIRGQKILFQFQYRDKQDRRRESDDPSDPTKTLRIIRLEAWS